MGGILGVSSGFSLITAIELFYWFTVRIVADHYKKKNANRSDKKNKVSARPPKNRNDSFEGESGKQLGCHKCEKLEKEVKSQMEQVNENTKRICEISHLMKSGGI
jgi:hypothetical protein